MKNLTRNTNVEQYSGTVEQAVMRYGFGRNTMRRIAGEAGAIIKVGKCVRVNFAVMDKYLNDICGNE